MKKSDSPYLIPIKTFKIIATKVSWIPVTSMLGDEGPKKTPWYDGPKKNWTVDNVRANKTASNISWTEVKIKPVFKKKQQYLESQDITK